MEFADPLDNPNLSPRTRAEMLEGKRMLRVNFAEENVQAKTNEIRNRFGLRIFSTITWISASGEGEVLTVVTIGNDGNSSDTVQFTIPLSEFPGKELISFLMLATPK